MSYVCVTRRTVLLLGNLKSEVVGKIEMSISRN